jgi:hypothetical protein
MREMIEALETRKNQGMVECLSKIRGCISLFPWEYCWLHRLDISGSHRDGHFRVTPKTTRVSTTSNTLRAHARFEYTNHPLQDSNKS